MWLWAGHLRELGFRQLGDYYWQCATGYGLEPGSYLSLFAHTRTGRWRRRTRPATIWLDLAAFHVTFCFPPDRLHFYYHELAPGTWEAGGHTTAGEIRRHAVAPGALRASAHAVAARLLTALGQTLIATED